MIQSYKDVRHFWDQSSLFFLKQNFLVQTIVITFIYLLSLFIVQNLKKFLQLIQNYDNAPFLGPKWSEQIFFLKIITITFIYLLTPFTVKKKSK